MGLRVLHFLGDISRGEIGTLITKRLINCCSVGLFQISNNPIDLIIPSSSSPLDKRTKSWLLTDTPGPLFTILGTYLYFCLYAGPRFMKDRKPFQLKNVLIWYNAIQVALSVVLVWEGLEGGWRKHYNFRCQPVDYSDNPVALRVSRVTL